jgi:N-formylglutamate amidohydrolase
LKPIRLPLAALLLAGSMLAAYGDDAPVDPAKPAPKLVETIRGDLPLVLTAPHGGTLNVPGAPPRVNPTGKAYDFVTSRDTSTSELALEIAREIEKATGKRPYVVVLRAHRKYLDANRAPDDAHESPAAKAVYDEFQAAVTAFRREINEKWGTGLLIDVHGQTREPAAVFRGTRNGTTVTRLRARAGDSGPREFTAALEQAGLRMLPPSTSNSPLRETAYTGGHIVIAHGTAEEGGLDAVQLEFGGELRRNEVRPITARETAAGLSAFLAARYRLEARARRQE